MSWNILYNTVTDVVEIINEGVSTPGDLLAEVPAAYALAEEKGTMKFIVYGTKRKKLEVSNSSYFQVPKMLDKMPLVRTAPIALILQNSGKAAARRKR